MKKKHILFLFMLGMIGTNAWALDQKEGVYQIGTAEDLVAFAELVNNGEGTANAVLTADIDLGDIDWTPICAGSCFYTASGPASVTKEGFAGTFDGQGHTVSNFNITESSEADGFFGLVTGTVKNLGIVNAAFNFSRTYRSGAIAGTVTATGESTGLVENCYVTDSRIISPGNVCGAVAGAVYGGVVQNCFAANNELSGYGDRFGGIAGDTRSDGGWTGIVANCYTDFNRMTSSRAGTTTGGEGSVSAERFQSGEIAYKLNGDQSDIVWYQTLGEDTYPVLTATSKKVYVNPSDGFRCDGTPMGEITFTNDEVTVDTPTHEYENGFCKYCGEHDPDFVIPVNDVYPLGSAEELVWFAAKVNSGESTVNAVLTADIDLGGIDWTSIGAGSCYWYATGTASVTSDGFAGTFDGQGHTVSNFNITESSEADGFFGLVTGTIKNLGIVNVTFNSSKTYRAGAIAGTVAATEKSTGLVENCYVLDSRVLGIGNVCGAVAGAVYGGVVQNCFAANNELSGYGNRFGGIAGDTRSDGGWKGTVANCYTDFVRITSSQAGTTIGSEGSVSAERFQSGEIVYKLNGSTVTLESVWHQNLGEDPYPLFDSTHGYVLPLGDAYISFTEDNFEGVRDEIYEKEINYNESVICNRALNGIYEDALNTFSELSTIEEFFPDYDALMTLKSQLAASATSYAAYQAKIDEINAYLAENDATVVGKDREVLDDYLKEAIEPNATYPNGSYPYIMENREVDNTVLVEEIDFAQKLLDWAIAGGYTPGSDITNLLVNADFSKDIDGWSVENGSLSVTHVAEAETKYIGYSNGKTRLSQTITDLKPGIYLVKVNAVYRAAGDNTNLNQAAFLFANTNKVYVPTLREGIIPTDSQSPHLDLYDPIEDDFGDFIGYQPNSTNAIAYAFGDGYYENSIATEVGEDGTLTIGVQTLGCNRSNDTWVGAFRLMYCGTADTEYSKEAFAEVQNCQLARLNTMANNYVCDNFDYQAAPSYSEALKQEAATAVENGPVDADQLAKIIELGNLMQTIYDCKQAYAEMISKADVVLDLYSSLSNTSMITEEEGNAMMDAYTVIGNAYIDGTFSIEEALAADPIKGLSIAPTFDGDVAQISNGKELLVADAMVNSGFYRDMDIVLLNDIDMEGISCAPIGYANLNELNHLGQPIINPGYAGTFDGRGHVIKNLTATYNPEYAANGVFGTVTGTVKNLGVVNYHFDMAESPVYYSGRFGALCGQLVEGTILNCYVTGSTVIISSEIASSIAAGNYGGTIQNCYEYGNNIQPYPRSGMLVGDARDDNSVRIGTEINSYSEGNVTGNYNSKVIDCESQVSKERFRSGEIAYLLNGGAVSDDEVVWYQSILEDESPVLDDTHYIVRQTEDGYYTNFDETNAKLLALIQEAQTLSASTRFSGHLPLIVNGGQLSENCFWRAGNEIQNIIDGNFGTYFHSRIDVPLAEGTEYFQVNLDAPVNGFYIEYTGRSDGVGTGYSWHDTPDKIRIEATNTPEDESSWTIVSIEQYDIPNKDGAYYKSEDPILLGDTYQYIRFYILHATSGQNYWNIAEFQMYDAADTSSPELLKAVSDIDAAIEEKLALVKKGAGTQTDIGELQALIDVLRNLTGIEQIAINSTASILYNENIYTLDGRLVNSNVSADDVRALPKGLYIIKGRKVLVK